MEATREKGKQKKRSKATLSEDVPEAPRLEDFQNLVADLKVEEEVQEVKDGNDKVNCCGRVQGPTSSTTSGVQQSIEQVTMPPQKISANQSVGSNEHGKYGSKLEEEAIVDSDMSHKVNIPPATSVAETEWEVPLHLHALVESDAPHNPQSQETVSKKSEATSTVPPAAASLYPTLDEIECTQAVEMSLQAVDINELDDSVDPCEEAIPTAPVKTESGVFFSLTPQQICELSEQGQVVSRSDQVAAADVTRTPSAELARILQRIRIPKCQVSQISALYNNLFIENCEVEVKEFLGLARSTYDGYELYELLCNYQRAFNQLGVCEKSLYDLREQFSLFEKEVWTIRSETLRQQVVCKDENTVEASHQYHTATMSQEAFAQLERSLQQVKQLTKDSFPLYTYSVQLCRAQVDHFFHKHFSHVNLQSFEIQGYHTDYPNAQVGSTATNLKLAISTLFIFVRKHNLHRSFVEDLKRWLSNSVGLLLRLATLRDHHFILNHVLRIPPGSVNKWACRFVQIPQIPIPTQSSEYFGSFSHINLDYALAALNLILKPVCKRDEFLKQQGTPYRPQGAGDSLSPHQWVVIDSDGEDDPEDSSFFKESDLIALLHQIPFDKIFKRILLVCDDKQGMDIYDIHATNELHVLKLIEFTKQLVSILGQGFVSYYTDRYRQLTKLIGRLILHATKYVTEHVENFLNRDGLVGEDRESRLKTEYDIFLMSSVSVLLSGRNIGTLQFLAAIPFHLVSQEILWDAYALITKWASSERDGIPCEEASYEFENDLVSMNESDAFYLLNTLSNMAIAREGKEPHFIRIVTFHLFQIGFLSPVTRDTCSKHARDLLGALTKKYPYLISVLLDVVKIKMDILDSMSLYLMKELAFDVWKPTALDLKLMSHWLINYSVGAIESQTCRFVIQSMNWAFDDKGELFLPSEIHLKVGLVIYEAYCKWMKGQTLLSGVTSLASRGQDNYITWAWEQASKLHFHMYDRSNNPIRKTALLRTIPTFESNPELEQLRTGIADKNPLASFLALQITTMGNSIPVICPFGIDQLETLIANSKYEAGLHVLFFLTPIFVACGEALYRNEKFRSILSALLMADMTYMRMAKNLIKYDFPGYYTKMFGDMVSTQIQQHERFQTSAGAIIKFWVDCVTKLENWNKDKNSLHILDVIAKYCFTREEWQTCFLEQFTAVYKELSATTPSGIASFLFSWSSCSKTLLPTPFYSSSPYFTYAILTIETKLENETGFWNSVMVHLANPKISVEATVKKACSASKLTTSPNFLAIYRWAQFALELPVDHQLTFLVWQKFFTRFLFRPITGDSNQGVGVGERFFEGMVNAAFAKRLKARLHETLEHYRNKLHSTETMSVEENASENPVIMIDYYKECVNVATAFSLWIEDPQMHSASLYLPALPPQFLPLRLLSVMEGCQIEWKEFVNHEEIEANVRSVAVGFTSLVFRSGWYERDGARRRRLASASTYDDRQDEILRRFDTYDQPLDPPPAPILERVLPAVSANMLTEPKSMLSGMSAHFKALTTFAGSFSNHIAKQTALDCSYGEHLPELYNQFPGEALVNVRCSGTKKSTSCLGPGHFLFKYTEARLNEITGRQIHQNRTDYETLLNDKLTRAPPMAVCVAAVLLEDFITTLIVNFRNLPENHPDQMKTGSVGAELFYQLVELINEEANYYPPTRQLFTSSAEVLGREFISPHSSQYRKLVSKCIAKPSVVGVIAPNINLALCSTSILIEIYKDVTNIPKKDADLAFVILTKFDISCWLRKTKPKLFERSQLISYIWSALTAEGYEPDQCPMVFDVFRNHFKAMLLYDFPQHYGEILNYLLEGTGAQTVPLLIWFDFFNCLSHHVIRFKVGMDSAVKRREIKRFATEANIIHHHELIETARLLARHFTKERLAYGIYGLYPKYRNYIEALSCFMQLISVSIVASTLKNSKGSVSQQSIWPVLHDLYAPWILPYNQKTIQQQCAQWIQQMNFDSASVLHPWVANDSSCAIVFMNDFTDCLMFLVETLPGTGSLFSCLWGFYVDNFATSGVKPHVLGVVHNCLVSVPWTIFWPSFSDVETMSRVVEKYLPSCHSFLAVIFAQVNWLEWIKHLTPSMISKGIGILLNLTVRLANDTTARESPSWVCVMERALYQMSWENVSPSSLEPVLNWFVMSIDPRVVLHLEGGHHMDNAVLKLLKCASGFMIAETPSSPVAVAPASGTSSRARSDISHKRYLFVRSSIRLLVTASTKYKQMLGTHSKQFEDSITLLLDDIVAVIRSESTPTEEFLPQLQELISLMSNHYLGTIARNALIEWCNSRRDAPLPVLYVMVHLSFLAKVPAYVVIPLVEAVMTLCFAHPGATWPELCDKATLSTDEREVATYFEVSSKDGHFLVLHALLLKRFHVICRGSVNSINFLSDLLKNLKPRETNEEAMPLVYTSMIRCSLHILKSSGSTSPSGDALGKSVKKFLNAVAQHLSLYADDKQTWGILGALGLGKASQLTLKGRLFARCLSVFILAQLPSNGEIRVNVGGLRDPASPESSLSSGGTSKPHSEYSSSMEKLAALKISRPYSQFDETIDFATGFTENPSKSLDHLDQFVRQLNGLLFTARYLFDSG